MSTPSEGDGPRSVDRAITGAEVDEEARHPRGHGAASRSSEPPCGTTTSEGTTPEGAPAASGAWDGRGRERCSDGRAVPFPAGLVPTVPTRCRRASGRLVVRPGSAASCARPGMPGLAHEDRPASSRQPGQLVQDQRSCRRQVEAGPAAHHGDLDDAIEVVPGLVGEAPALVAQDDDGPPASGEPPPAARRRRDLVARRPSGGGPRFEVVA